MVLIAMMAAVTCILGPLSLSIPVSPVPISLTNLAVYFTVYVLGMKLGTVSYLIYMLLGLVGLPVFSGFSEDTAKLFGPIGGYIYWFHFHGGYLRIFYRAVERKAVHAFYRHGAGNGGLLSVRNSMACLSGKYGLLCRAWSRHHPIYPGRPGKIIIALIAGPMIRKWLRTAGLN